MAFKGICIITYPGEIPRLFKWTESSHVCFGPKSTRTPPPPLTVVTTVAVEEVLFLFQYLYVASMLRAQEAERCHFTREIQNDRARDPVRTTRIKNFKHPIPKTRNQLYITATSQSTDFYEQHPFSKERTCPSGMRAP